MLHNVSNLSKFPNVHNVKNPDVHKCQTSGHYATFIDILGHFWLSNVYKCPNFIQICQILSNILKFLTVHDFLGLSIILPNCKIIWRTKKFVCLQIAFQNVKHDSKRFLFTVESAAAAEKRLLFAISEKVNGKFF